MGAGHEGGLLERLVWRVIGRTREGRRRFSDDTQMSLDLADSLLAHPDLDPDDLARRFAQGYRWSRGYGRGAARLLKQIRSGVDWRVANTAVFPEGSFGNGAAMRAPVVGVFYAADPAVLLEKAEQSAVITHAHPLGQEGAVLVALASRLALLDGEPFDLLDELKMHARSEAFRDRLSAARLLLDRGEVPVPVVVRTLGNGIQATDSCITAIYWAARFLAASFDDLMTMIIAEGGDVDTIGAMAGAIWGARNGMEALPSRALASLEQAGRIRDTAKALFLRRSTVLVKPRPGR